MENLADDVAPRVIAFPNHQVEAGFTGRQYLIWLVRLHVARYEDN